MRGTSKREKIIAYVKANPNKTAAQVASALGVRQKYVYVTKSAAGLTMPKQKPINKAMKHAITDALAKKKPAAAKRTTKSKVIDRKSTILEIKVYIQLQQGTIEMTMDEARKVYNALKQEFE